MALGLGRHRLSRCSGMAKLIYATNLSLDGYIEDERGSFDMGPLDDDLFASYTDLLRSVGTFLYGRRLYEAMAVWETNADLAAQSGPYGRLRDSLASSDQSRLLDNPGRRAYRKNPARTPIRACVGTRHEGFGYK